MTIKQNKKYFEMKASDDKESADIFIYGDIVSDGGQWTDSDTSAVDFRDALKELGDVKKINLHINSPGGSVFDGVAIMSMLKQNKATVNVYIDGLAASIASVIAMAGDKVYIADTAMIMIHNPWTMAVGNADELRKQANDLDKISQSMKQAYLDKAGDKINEPKLTDLMNAETWLSASEAVDLGLADEIVEGQQIAACVDKDLFSRYKHVPDSLQQEVTEDSVHKHNQPVKAPEESAQEKHNKLVSLKKKILRGEI